MHAQEVRLDAGREHTDEPVCDAFEIEAVTENGRVSPVSPGPSVERQNDDRLRAGTVLAFSKCPTEEGLHAQQIHEVPRHRGCTHGFDLTRPRKEARASHLRPRDIAERPTALAPFQGIRRCCRPPALSGSRLVNRHELAGPWVGKRTEQDTIDDREDGGIPANPEGEGPYSDGGIAGVVPEQPQPDANVRDDPAHPSRGRSSTPPRAVANERTLPLTLEDEPHRDGHDVLPQRGSAQPVRWARLQLTQIADNPGELLLRHRALQDPDREPRQLLVLLAHFSKIGSRPSHMF